MNTHAKEYDGNVIADQGEVIFKETAGRTK
jgi:hypothetical protein